MKLRLFTVSNGTSEGLSPVPSNLSINTQGCSEYSYSSRGPGGEAKRVASFASRDKVMKFRAGLKMDEAKGGMS